MATSNFFRRTFDVEQDPVADEYYERTVGLVFEKEDEAAKVEVRCWSIFDLESYQTRDAQLEPIEDAAQTAIDQAEAPDIGSASKAMPKTPWFHSARLAIIDLIGS